MSKSRRRPKKPNPGPIRAPVSDIDAAALNRAFYSADPGDYFGMRLRSLIEFASLSEAEYRSGERTFRYGELEMTVQSVDDDPPNERSRTAFILIEAEMLLHHLAETLLRLYIAHEPAPRVPWLKVTELRGPGDLKSRVEKLLEAGRRDDLRAGVGWVWLGSREAPEEQHQSWESATTTIGEYIQYFGRLLLDRAPAYNAVKHGLAVQSGDTRLSLAGIPELTVEGPSIAWLSHSDREGIRHVVVKNLWIDHHRELAMVYMGRTLLDGLWNAARTRYAGWPVPQEVKLPHPVQDVLMAGRKPHNMRIGGTEFPPWAYSPPGSGADALGPK